MLKKNDIVMLNGYLTIHQHNGDQVKIFVSVEDIFIEINSLQLATQFFPQ